jgi:hypothetical protein
MKNWKRLLVLSVMLALAGCGSNQSAAFKKAGCIAAEGIAMNEAAVQFDLAAQSGDPAAVGAAIAAQNIWASLMNSGRYNSLEEVLAGGEYVEELASEIATYCGSEYDIK